MIDIDEHPTPWSYSACSGDSGGRYIEICDSDGVSIAECGMSEENAAHIVACVNTCALMTAAEQHAARVPDSICTLGIRGKAYDPPDVKRAYTYIDRLFGFECGIDEY